MPRRRRNVPGHSITDADSAAFDLRALRVASGTASLVSVGCRGVREERRGQDGARYCSCGFGSVGVLRRRVGSGLKPCEDDCVLPRASATAGGVGHLHESALNALRATEAEQASFRAIAAACGPHGLAAVYHLVVTAGAGLVASAWSPR